MSRRRALFTEADVRRACKAAPDRVVEIVDADGVTIRIIPPAKAVEKREIRM